MNRCASVSTEQNPNPEPPENLSDDDSDDNDGEAVAGAKVCLDDLLRSEHFSPKPGTSSTTAPDPNQYPKLPTDPGPAWAPSKSGGRFV